MIIDFLRSLPAWFNFLILGIFVVGIIFDFNSSVKSIFGGSHNEH